MNKDDMGIIKVCFVLITDFKFYLLKFQREILLFEIFLRNFSHIQREVSIFH